MVLFVLGLLAALIYLTWKWFVAVVVVCFFINVYLNAQSNRRYYERRERLAREAESRKGRLS
jgi:membrane protein implicated in regulation of membrane protease activity